MLKSLIQIVSVSDLRSIDLALSLKAKRSISYQVILLKVSLLHSFLCVLSQFLSVSQPFIP